MPSATVDDRRAATTVAWTSAKRTVRSAVVWGALFGVLIANEALDYHSAFPTEASRQKFAESFGSNGGLTAVTGPARHLETVGGAVAWRVMCLMIVVGAVWGLLTSTRLLRGEEDAGRWELLLAGRTARRHATVQALAGMAVGWFALWAVTAAFTVAAGSSSTVGFATTASLFYATAGVASAAMFLAVGALTSQLAGTRRQANALGAAVFAVAYLLKLVADAGTGLAWVRWATPFGWVENMAPLTGSQPLALLPVVALVVAAAAGAVVTAGRRDAGVGLLGRREAKAADVRLLNGPAGLVARLDRWVALAWVAGLSGLGLLFAVVARSAEESSFGDSAVSETVGRLGGAGSTAAAWIGYEFLYIAAVLSFAAAGQIAAARNEEADGHLDNLLAGRVSRARWLSGRLGFAAVMVVAAGLATGVAGWLGVAGRGGISLLDMVAAGVNIAVPALFVLGVGTLLYGLAPRLAAPALYVLVLWSFLVEVIGTSLTSNHWLLDTAVLSHLGPVPAADLDWAAIAWLIGLAGVATLAGFATFNRRDLAAA